ncbi:MAG: asparagine synthase (glutamine-hydrolyzing) [Victivallales bacterium]|nr:asparagine synthase (glutamine-hydrolyzing) [Victivallales bacterium]
MCGISGIFHPQFQDSHLEYVKLMVQAMKHRGPDAQNTLIVSKQPAVVFGHDRFAVFDLSPQAAQPMTDSANSNVIILNGDIYNFKNLRKELQGHGHVFKTQSDTEVLLKAYAQWGDDCLNRLRGFFAFALWDAAKQRLLLARDQIGAKPLYIYRNGDEIRFASEFRALLASGIPRELDMDGVLSYLNYGSVQDPLSLARNVRSLRPAHKLVWQDGKTTVTRYWEPDLSPSDEKPEDLVNELIEEMKTVVKMQLAADVPVGAFLSGGIDSSAIVALLHQVRSDITLNTYTLTFDDTTVANEKDYAKLVAVQNKTCHRELLLETKTIRKYINTALDDYDLPSFDGLNTWFVAKLAKATGLGVALSGIGGDEIFAGYSRFATAFRMEKSAKWLRLFPHGLGLALARKTRDEKLRKTFQMFGIREQPYYLSRQMFSPLTIAELLGRPLEKLDFGWRSTAFPQLMEMPCPDDPINRFSYLELNTYLVSTLLRDSDQIGMAHALPIRGPLLDKVIVEKALRIPGQYKVSPDCPKPILVKAAGKGLPAECVNRKKQSFELPFASFFNNYFKKPIKDFLYDNDALLFSPDALKAIGRLHEQKKLIWSRLWTLFTLDRFCRKHNLHS